ncbi:peroxidase 2 [Brachypodium distachyon]|uniref:peroxidase n=1 Tax=Brachypodium distachyon TaxID=15368 RepID=I1GRV9_BRADI|nr:peroxidase 2 [Brachypodium distachyon]KQK14990.1 hypothetical protein BRADI_1g20000v3 [Brachypodium distachyon]|eukprot:XP_024316453.1 peroxidase 2 [Brachypodium distachyon]
MVKLAVLTSLLALMLIGSAFSQGAPAYPPSPSPSPVSSDRMTHPPSANPGLPMNPPNVSPSPSLLAYPPTSTGPSRPSPSAPAYPPTTSPPISPPSISIVPSPRSPIQAQPVYPPSSSTPAYEPSPSPSKIAYPPSPSPQSPVPAARSPSPASSPQRSYPPSPSPAPAAVYPPFSAPPINPPSPSPSPTPPSPGLTVGHYKYSCPNAEEIVRQAVKAATDKNLGTGAGLIRLFFHDCFVRGCDASVLLNTTGTGEPTERQGAPNLTLRGFEAIDAAKSALELACPGVVSCADTLAFAARDAAFFLGTGGGGASLLDFAMPAGRRDGRVSLASETVPNLPSPSSTLAQLVARFGAKGLGVGDMVALSGAHSVGRARCSSFSARLAEPSAMDPELARSLWMQCGASGESMVMEDFRTPDVLDAKYYENVVRREVLFGSDAALMASEGTTGMVVENARVSGLWERRFAAAMVRMGAVGAKTGVEDGEIRKKCWIIN